MESIDKLTELIEQAACSINMLNPTDLPEIESLQKILDQINQAIDEIGDGPAQILAQAKGTTFDAAGVLQKILQHQVQDTAQSIDAVSQAVCTLQNLIDQVTQDSAVVNLPAAQANTSEDVETVSQEAAVICEEDVPLILDFITESDEHIESAEAGLLELETKPDDKEVLNQIFRSFHSIKGLAGFLNLTDIGSLAHAAENLLDLARKGQLLLAGKNTDFVFKSIDMLKNMVADLKESVEAGKALPVQKHLPRLLEKLKVATKGSLQKNGEKGLQYQTLDDVRDKPLTTKDDQKLDEILAAKEDSKTQDSASQTKTKAKTQSGDEKIKVSTTRLDNLINMTGELVISQLMIAEEASTKQTSEHELNRKVTHQGKVIRELQELSMSMRMVPIQGAFQKMARLVRDLSNKAGKNINFVTMGEETELDRSIVDKIVDPLVHMVRNSVDHGIESPEERKKMGKNPNGQIELRAFHQAGNIIIEVEDDGKGLSKGRILKKAIESGIVKADQELSDQEIFELIFHPGFSTAQKVTKVSGRGVGMDVVKKNTESLRGKININSTHGKGTTFTIRLPLTLAIIDGLVVKVGNERYIIPICSILGIIKPKLKEFSSVQNRGEMINVRGQLIHIVRLYKLFGIVPKTEDLTESLLVLVEEGSKKCCLLIDELLGHQQVVIKSLGKGLGKTKGVSGGAIMGDGKVSLILDIPGLIELAQR
jgi:two-component system chemotaxis sensor kinase CheA